LPWLNYLGQDEFFGLCTNTAGGYTFWKDAKLRRLTRYRYNNVPYDLGGRYLYVNDGGSVWNPGWKPVKAANVDKYECRHGIGLHDASSASATAWRWRSCACRPGENLEVWQRHRAQQVRPGRKAPKLFSYQEFCFFEALNDMTNYQRTYSIGEVEVEGSRSTTRPSTANGAVTTRCSPARAGCRLRHLARCLRRHSRRSARSRFRLPASCYELQGRLAGIRSVRIEVDLDLQPGESETFAFMLAYVDHTLAIHRKVRCTFCDQQDRWRAIVAKYSAPGAVEAAFAASRRYWDELLGKIPGRSARTSTPTAW
jgi:cellobiose phosphorylase